MPRLARVALIIETSRQYGRELLRGIIQHQNEHRGWIMYFQPHTYGDPPPGWFQSWQGDGILARIVDKRVARAVLRKRIPTIDLRGVFSDLGVPRVAMRNDEIVRMAFSHLRECGFRNFGFCGLPEGQNEWVDKRRRLFEQTVAAAGTDSCRMFLGKFGQDQHASLKNERPQFIRWIARLPKPIGIMAGNDDIGQQVLDACRSINVRVPDEVGVIGADNDEFLCNLAYPQLTSIDMNLHNVGYQAAAMLDRMMAGDDLQQELLQLVPRRVVPRASTDIRMFGDADFSAALSYIRENACDGITVADLVEHLAISRRVVERRFQTFLGRTPHDEIVRVRLERAKQLLTDSDLPLTTIAERIGVGTASHLCALFRERLGMSPAEFRGMDAKPSAS